MKLEQEIKAWLDREWQEAMARTGFFRMRDPVDNSPPFDAEQSIARAKIFFIERLEKELEISRSHREK